MRHEERLRVLEGLLRKVEAAAERRGIAFPSRVPSTSWLRSHAVLGQKTPPPNEGDMSDFDRNPTQELALPIPRAPESHASSENGAARPPGAPASRPLWASPAIGETLPDPRPHWANSAIGETLPDPRTTGEVEEEAGDESDRANDEGPDSEPRALLTGPTPGALDTSPPTRQNVSFQVDFVDEITSHGDPAAIEALVLKEAELAHGASHAAAEPAPRVEPARVEPARVEPARVEPAGVEPAGVEPALDHRTERAVLSIPTEDDIFEMDEVGDDLDDEDSRTTLPPDAPLDPPFDDDTGSDEGGDAPMGPIEPPQPVLVTRGAAPDVVVEWTPPRDKTFLELLREAMAL